MPIRTRHYTQLPMQYNNLNLNGIFLPITSWFPRTWIYDVNCIAELILKLLGRRL